MNCRSACRRCWWSNWSRRFAQLNAEGMSILLVEQDVTTALDLSSLRFHHGHGPDRSHRRLGAELLADPIIRDAYLGVLED